jgi:phosphoribosylformimino-5-aminoimidazole carboxamide ribotide isomerase
MRLIPVIDLFNSQAVHAVRGERSHYKPVKSLLCKAPDPIAIARVFRDKFGLSEIYIADLNAIQGTSSAGHRNLIEKLVSIEGMKIMLDSGAADIESARNWLELGIHKAVIGAETLKSSEDLKKIPEFISPDRLTFSLDMRSGKVISLCPEIALMPAMNLLEVLRISGWHEILMLDLNRVGSGEGTVFSLASETRSKFSDLELLIGGGIAGFEELLKLKAIGIDGVLLATALHAGAITAEQIWSAAAKPPL